LQPPVAYAEFRLIKPEIVPRTGLANQEELGAAIGLVVWGVFFSPVEEFDLDANLEIPYSRRLKDLSTWMGLHSEFP
jgi:hypothetical protein